MPQSETPLRYPRERRPVCPHSSSYTEPVRPPRYREPDRRATPRTCETDRRSGDFCTDRRGATSHCFQPERRSEGCFSDRRGANPRSRSGFARRSCDPAVPPPPYLEPADSYGSYVARDPFPHRMLVVEHGDGGHYQRGGYRPPSSSRFRFKKATYTRLETCGDIRVAFLALSQDQVYFGSG